MKGVLVFAAVAVLMSCGVALAEETTVYTTDQLRQTLGDADAGDRIYVAPGTYDQLLWVQNVHGDPGNLIEVVAKDPTDRPVFEEHVSSVFTFYDCSYILIDGVIVQGAGTATQDGNNIMLTNSDHIILRNALSRDIVHTGNSDGTKFNHSDNVLMYGCTVSEWGEGGSGMDGMVSHSNLYMRNTFTFPSLAIGESANGIMPKGAAYHHGMYMNHFIDGSSRAVCFGGSGGATGPEIYDSVAMGNLIERGEASLAYVSCTGCEFNYNTVINPEKWVMRVQKEGVYETDYNTFKRNLVYYGPFALYGGVQGTGGTVHPETFTYEANYWYKWDNPGASIPSLPGGEINPAGGTDPQLDAEYRPHLPAAKQYGAYAPQVEEAFQAWRSAHADPVTGELPFTWAWDRAQEIDPKADPGEVYHIGPDQELTFDASDSHAGSGSYDDDPTHPEWHHTITGYAWDLDWDSDFDDGSGETFAVNYWYLRTFLGLSAGWHTIELKITVSTPYGEIEDWGFAQLHIVDTLLPGDANYDGEVNGADYTAWADHYKQAGEWIDGDFNDDGVVDGADYTLWADNFTGGGSAVPEPTTLCLLTLAAAGLLRRRRP